MSGWEPSVHRAEVLPLSRIEWAFDHNDLWVVQARPITTPTGDPRSDATDSPARETLIKGVSAAPGLVSGQVRILASPEQGSRLQAGEVAEVLGVGETQRRVVAIYNEARNRFRGRVVVYVVHAGELGDETQDRVVSAGDAA